MKYKKIGKTWNYLNKGKIFIFCKILATLVWWPTFSKNYSFDASLVHTNPRLDKWAHGLIFIWNPGNFTARELHWKACYTYWSSKGMELLLTLIP